MARNYRCALIPCPFLLPEICTCPTFSLRARRKPSVDTAEAFHSVCMSQVIPCAAQVLCDGIGINRSGSRLEMEMKEASRYAISPKGFRVEGRRIGPAMRDQYRICVFMRRWDNPRSTKCGTCRFVPHQVEILGRGTCGKCHRAGWRLAQTLFLAVWSEFAAVPSWRTATQNDFTVHGSVHWLLLAKVSTVGTVGRGASAPSQSPLCFRIAITLCLNELGARIVAVFRGSFGDGG